MRAVVRVSQFVKVFGLVSVGLLGSASLVQAKSCCAYKLDTVLHQVNQLSQQVALLQSKTGCNALAITSAGEINTPGNYVLANNIYGGIILNAPNISLDLCGHYIFPVDASATTRSATKRSVTEAVAADAGIWVTAEASGSSILNQIIGGGVDGFKIGAYIEADSVTVDGVKCFNSDYGFYSPATKNCFFKNCWAAFFTVGGFYFESGSNNTCLTCKAVSGSNACSKNCVESADLVDVVGFHSVNAMSSFIGCSVEGITAAAGSNAAAVRLVADTGSIVDGSIIDGVSSADGAAHGIQLQVVPSDLEYLTAGSYFANVNAVSWHPMKTSKSARYLLASGEFDASFGAHASARLYRLNQSSGLLESSLSFTDVTGTSYAHAWSYDGNYLLVGGVHNGKNALFLYDTKMLDMNGTVSLKKVINVNNQEREVRSVSWMNPIDEEFSCYVFAVGVKASAGNNSLFVYEFDPASSAMRIASSAAPLADSSQYISSISWFDPFSFAVTIAGGTSIAAREICQVYEFDDVYCGGYSLLNKIAVIKSSDSNVNDSSFEPLTSSALYLQDSNYNAPDYFVFAGVAPLLRSNLFVYQVHFGVPSYVEQKNKFTPQPIPLINKVTSVSFYSSGTANSFLAVGAYDTTTPSVRNFLYIYPLNILLNSNAFIPGPVGSSEVGLDSFVAWSSDGKYLADGGHFVDPGRDGKVNVFTGLTQAANCVLQNNLVNGVAAPFATGIYANSLLDNYVAKNTVLNTAQSYAGVSPDLVTDQVNAIVAGNVYSGNSSAGSSGQLTILDLWNHTKQTVGVGKVFPNGQYAYLELKPNGRIPGSGGPNFKHTIQLSVHNPLSVTGIDIYNNPQNYFIVAPLDGPTESEAVFFCYNSAVYQFNWKTKTSDKIICACQCKTCSPCKNVTAEITAASEDSMPTIKWNTASFCG